MKLSNQKNIAFTTPKTLRYTALLSVAALGVFSGAQALADTDSVTVDAEVIQPITLTAVDNMNFGTFAASDNAGTVVLTTDNQRSSTNVMLSGIGVSAVASFTVGGEGSANYTITLPDTVALVGPTDSSDMGLNVFSRFALDNAIDPDTSGTLTTEGAETFYLGGTLQVGATQAPGSYAGTIEVSVAYD